MRVDKSGSWRIVLVDAGTVALAGVIGVGVTVGHAAVLRPYGGGTAAVMVGLAGSLRGRRRAAVAVAWLAVAGSGALLPAQMGAPGGGLGPGALPALALPLAATR